MQAISWKKRIFAQHDISFSMTLDLKVPISNQQVNG